MKKIPVGALAARLHLPQDAMRRALWRRALLPALLVGAGLVMAKPSHAQAWPQKPITLIAPFATGGSTDMLARVVGQALSKELGQPVVVDNRSGA